MLLEEELKERGHEVLIAYNGQAGVNIKTATRSYSFGHYDAQNGWI